MYARLILTWAFSKGISFDFDPSLDLYGEINQAIVAKVLADYSSELNSSSDDKLPTLSVLVKNFLQQVRRNNPTHLHNQLFQTLTRQEL